MKKRKREAYPVPSMGQVFYEVGFKREEPAAPIVITWVYGGTVERSGAAHHLLIEFSRWWLWRQQEGKTSDPPGGLLIPTLEQLYEGRETWDQVVRWVRKCGRRWRNAMKD